MHVVCRVSIARYLCARLSARGAEALATQDRSSTGRLERHGIGLATLITSYFKPLAVSSRAPGRPKIGAASIATRLATLWVSQIAFLIVLLFSLSKRKCGIALNAGDFDVWHDAFSPRATPGAILLLLVSERRLEFLV